MWQCFSAEKHCHTHCQVQVSHSQLAARLSITSLITLLSRSVTLSGDVPRLYLVMPSITLSLSGAPLSV